MGAAFATSAPTNQVEDLMKQVAAENDLDITEQLKDLHPGQSTLEASAAEPSKEESLSRRYTYHTYYQSYDLFIPAYS